MATIDSSTELAKTISDIVKSEPKTEDRRYHMFIETLAEAVGAYRALIVGNIQPPDTRLGNWSVAFRATPETWQNAQHPTDIATDVSIEARHAEQENNNEPPNTVTAPHGTTTTKSQHQDPDLPQLVAEAIAFEGAYLWLTPNHWLMRTSADRMMTGTDVEIAKTLMLDAGGAVIDVRNAIACTSLAAALTEAVMMDEFSDPGCDRKKWLQDFGALYRKTGAVTHNIDDPEQEPEPNPEDYLNRQNRRHTTVSQHQRQPEPPTGTAPSPTTNVPPRPGNNKNESYIDDLIQESILTPGGHLWITTAKWTLHPNEHHSLSGYDVDRMKKRMLDAGGAVIDIREANSEQLEELAFCGPIIAIGHNPNYTSITNPYETIEDVAEKYRLIGAITYNIERPLPKDRASTPLTRKTPNP